MKAMILAAGRGERMGSLTADTPKPLLSIGRETLIERHLRRLAERGFDEIVINLSYQGELIRQALGDRSAWDQRIVYSEEGPSPLETAGGIIQALPELGPDPFLVVSADVVTDFDFSALISGSPASSLVLVPNPPHHPDGDFGLSPSGELTSSPPLLTYSGIGRLDPHLFDGLAPGVRPLRPVFDDAVARGVLGGILHEGLWSDVGTPERLAEVRAVLER